MIKVTKYFLSIFIFIFIFNTMAIFGVCLEPRNGFVKSNCLKKVNDFNIYKVIKKVAARSGNGLNFRRLFTLKKGEYVKVHSEIGDWFHITIANKEELKKKKKKKIVKTVNKEKEESTPLNSSVYRTTITYNNFIALFGKDSKLDPGRQEELWLSRFRHRPITWAGVFDKYENEAGKLTADFFISAISDEPDVIVTFPEDQIVLLKMIKKGDFVRFSGSLWTRPTDDDPTTYIEDGKLILN